MMYFAKLIGGPLHTGTLRLGNPPIELELPHPHPDQKQVNFNPDALMDFSPISLCRYERRLIIGDEKNRLVYYFPIEGAN